MDLKWQFPELLQFLFEDHRYKVAYGGRGGLKSWTFARALLALGLTEKERVLCAREVQKSIRESVHQLLVDQIKLMGLEGHYEVLRDEIRGANGTKFSFTGLQDQTMESLKSYEGVTKCWVEEARNVSKRSWDILLPTIFRTKKSECWVSFNPELDTDETYKRFVLHPPDDCVVVKTGWQSNPWMPESLNQNRLDALKQVKAGVLSQVDYDNIWEGVCRPAVEGAIFASEVAQAFEEKRVRPVPYDPLLKVHTIWDLGWNDKTCIIMAQRGGNQIMVVDYIEDSHRTYADYVGELEQKRYRWGNDFVPHDARHKDPKEGKSTIDVLQALGRKCVVVPDIGVESGIQEARLAFSRIYFDEVRTTRLLECLRRYKRQIHQTTQEAGAPQHDEFSHGADAFRYMAVIAEQMTNESRQFKGKIQYDTRGIV